MLVLSRKLGEKIIIEPGIEIAVIEIQGGKVRLGIEAPRDIAIRREELTVASRTSSEKLAAIPR